MFEFRLLHTRAHARAGLLSTPHGSLETPVFMPVGTQASVKSLTADDVEACGAQIILANTYHLYLRPGDGLIAKLGGVHSFSRWLKPMLTDSGGYQVSSLGLFNQASSASLSNVDDEGVSFQSHIDGSSHRITPKKSIEIQTALGADIIMAFDEATPNKGKPYAIEAMRRTHRWLGECVKTWNRLEAAKGPSQPPQALFGIIQGGRYEDLRKESAAFVGQQDLPGIALGGESIGGDMEATLQTIAWIRHLLPNNRPRYAMGLGTQPNDVIQAVLAGMDMFDCVAPTRLARCGLLYCGNWEIAAASLEKAQFQSEYPHARLVIEKSRYKEDGLPIMPDCDCYTCSQGYSRAYLHHLFKAKELTYYRLASIHNLRVMIKTVELMRQAILQVE
jgi:queuine tRNA-ribosyltransferase